MRQVVPELVPVGDKLQHKRNSVPAVDSLLVAGTFVVSHHT